MNIQDCVRNTIDNEPNFKNRVLAIVKNRAEPLLISDFEHEYMNRYNLDFSRLYIATARQKQ